MRVRRYRFIRYDITGCFDAKITTKMKDLLSRFYEPMLLDEILLHQRVQVMHWVITFNLLVCLIAGGYYSVTGIYPTRVTFIFILWAVGLLMAYLMLHRGDVTLAGIYFTFIDWLVLSYLAALIHGEINSPFIATNLLIAIAAGLLLGRVVGLIYAGLGILSVVTIFAASQVGILPAPLYPLTPWRSLIFQVMNLALIVVIIGFTTRVIRESLLHARKHQNELVEKNRELEATRASLELQVEKRTAEILKQKQYFEALMQNSPLAIVALNQQHCIVAINQAFEKLFGYTPSDAIGCDLDSLIATPETLAEALKYTHSTLAGEQVNGSSKRRRKDGSLVDVEIFGVPVFVEGNQVGVLGLYQDITARKESEHQLQFLATHDLLTVLPNRFLFNDHLQQALTKAKRYHRSFAVLFLDLDGFKEVNDTFGHQKGDLILQQVAKRLKSCVRESDMLARQGGDEFSFILEDIKDEQAAISISNKILAGLAEPFLIEGGELSVTASIGISLYPEDGEDIEALLKKADSAMYKAKGSGGNTCTCHAQPFADIAIGRG